MQIKMESTFKKDIKVFKNDKGVLDELEKVCSMLMNGERLDTVPKYKNHIMVKFDWKGLWNCHLRPNVVLLYRKDKDTITLHRIGSHQKLGLTN